jgi:hypothetical protein
LFSVCFLKKGTKTEYRKGGKNPPFCLGLIWFFGDFLLQGDLLVDFSAFLKVLMIKQNVEAF